MDRDTQQELLGFAFADAWFLLLVPVLVVAWIVAARRRLPALGVASVLPFAELPRTWRVRLAALPVHLTLLGLLSLVLAIARPQRLDRVPVPSEGIDIFLVLDLSSSMSSQDMAQERATGARTRLDVAKDVAADFIARRDRDRIGLVTFAMYPDLVCPVTVDHEALERFLRPLAPKAQGSPEDRTGLGAGLALAVQHLEDSPSPSRVVVLLTDGLENVNYVTPEDATKLAKDAGVRVYTIGAGQGMLGPFGGSVQLDFSMLEEIARATGGAFFEARDEAALSAIFARIDELERVELEDPVYRADERFLPWLSVGAALLFAAALLRLGPVLDGP